MRNALILLAVVAGLILLAGAMNHAVAFDIDYVIGTANDVSLAWVAVVVAGVSFAAGVAATWLARLAGARTRRKLERELGETYARLRAAEAMVVGARESAEQAETTVLGAEEDAERTSSTAVAVAAPPEETAVTATEVAEPADGTAVTAIEAAELGEESDGEAGAPRQAEPS